MVARQLVYWVAVLAIPLSLDARYGNQPSLMADLDIYCPKH